MAPLADLLLKPEGGKSSNVRGVFECLYPDVLSNVALTLPKTMQNQHSSEDRLVAYTFSVGKGYFNNH